MKGTRHIVLMIIILVLMCFGFSLSQNSHLTTEESVKDDGLGKNRAIGVSPAVIPKESVRGISVIAIEDPNGNKHIWPMYVLSPKIDRGILTTESILSAYKYETIDGIRFYKVSAWKDMSKLMEASQQDIQKMIWQLAGEVSDLKSRVDKLEKKLLDLAKKDDSMDTKIPDEIGGRGRGKR